MLKFSISMQGGLGLLVEPMLSNTVATNHVSIQPK